jgi:hypothetical protein
VSCNRTRIRVLQTVDTDVTNDLNTRVRRPTPGIYIYLRLSGLHRLEDSISYEHIYQPNPVVTARTFNLGRATCYPQAEIRQTFLRQIQLARRVNTSGSNKIYPFKNH